MQASEKKTVWGFSAGLEQLTWFEKNDDDNSKCKNLKIGFVDWIETKQFKINNKWFLTKEKGSKLDTFHDGDLCQKPVISLH